MLRLKLHHTPRISNTLAVFAALMLLGSSLAGVGSSIMTGYASAGQSAEIESEPSQILNSEAAVGITGKKSKSFKVSLFLFRID
jgi:hypothetical protein